MNKLYNFVYELTMLGALALVVFNLYRAWPVIRLDLF